MISREEQASRRISDRNLKIYMMRKGLGSFEAHTRRNIASEFGLSCSRISSIIRHVDWQINIIHLKRQSAEISSGGGE